MDNKTKVFFKVVRDAFRWIELYFTAIGRDSSTVGGVGNAFATAADLYSIRSVFKEGKEMLAPKSFQHFVDKTSQTAMYGASCLKTAEKLNLVGPGKHSPLLGPIQQVTTIISGLIGTYNTLDDIDCATIEYEGLVQPTAGETRFIDSYQTEKWLDVAYQATLIVISVLSLAVMINAAQIASAAFLAVSSVALVISVSKFFQSKLAQNEWEGLRYFQNGSPIVHNPRFTPKAG